ncbi:MAG: 2-phospho-L-lactate guanylyltransferase [Ilumatobacter sp.]|uniref:2-phospho-L-lactate guanylyltransferase n=2 Tax=Ilumatobacter sp. TaxID=1967498 RepID=UPI003297CB54
MNVAVLVPVKAFTQAKQRLTDVLSPDDRRRLARTLADGVLAAAGEVPAFVVCDDDEVRDWASSRGAHPLWTAELGLNGAVDDGVRSVAAMGFDHVIVSHADLPLPSSLTHVARLGAATFVPDCRCDGTNVMSFPLDRPVSASYGPGSFTRHRDAATAAGLCVEIRVDGHLALDIDTASDLTHPLLREVLPTWLPTIPVNPFTHGYT